MCYLSVGVCEANAFLSTRNERTDTLTFPLCNHLKLNSQITTLYNNIFFLTFITPKGEPVLNNFFTNNNGRRITELQEATTTVHPNAVIQ